MSDVYNAVQHGQNEQQSREHRNRTDRLKAAIEKCSHALERGTRDDYYYIARRLDETILPALRDHTSKPLDDFDTELDGREDWDWVALSRFLNNAGSIIATLEQAQTAQSSDLLTLQSAGYIDSTSAARDTVERALHSVSCILEQVGVVKGKYTKTADAVGFSGQKIGRVYKDPKMPFDDEVEVIIEAGTIKSLYCGGTNAGKSTAAEGQFQDYYWRNFIDGKKDTKCIDPFDFSVAENVFYDVPQNDEALRDALEDMDLPADFTETDLDPKLEVYIPLSKRLTEERVDLPYDTESDEFVPKPFAIPASDISQDLFVSILSARLSESEVHTMREVYESVDRERANWRLKHLVDEIASRDELSDKHQRKAIRVVKSLQDFGFIRESPSEYELDWHRILSETETVTAFNQLLCRNKRERLFVLAWLLEAMWRERTKVNTRYPQMAMLLREMWAYAPQNQRREDDDIAEALQERIVTLLIRYLRQNRDVRTHILGDTQNLRDINIGVREEFNRFCLFDPKRWMAEKIFEWTGNERVDSFVRRIPPEPGECGIVGAVGPAYEHTQVEYVAPTALAPPTHHHHDKDDGNGFLVRTELVEHEEPRPVEEAGWRLKMPDELRIPEIEELLADDEDGEGDGDETPDIKVLHRQEARDRRRKGMSYRKIAKAIPNNPDTGRSYDHTTIKRWVDDIDPTDHAATAD